MMKKAPAILLVNKYHPHGNVPREFAVQLDVTKVAGDPRVRRASIQTQCLRQADHFGVTVGAWTDMKNLRSVVKLYRHPRHDDSATKKTSRM